MTASLNTYRSTLRGVNAKDAATVTDAQRMLKVPALAVGGAQDLVSRGDQMQSAMEPWAGRGYTEKTLDAGHWLMLEKKEELSSILIEFAARGEQE